MCGWLLQGDTLTLTDCVAELNGQPSPPFLPNNYNYGFLATSNGIRFENCKAISNGAPGNGFGEGFALAGTAYTLNNCEASLNSGPNGSYQINIDPFVIHYLFRLIRLILPMEL